jgi:excisionase family DNA binding protein
MDNTLYPEKLPSFTNLGRIPEQKWIFENLMTKKQLAVSLAVSEGFINKLMNEEGLPHIKLGRAVRYRVKEVVSWLQKRRRP